MDVAPVPARVLLRLAAVTSTVLALGAGAHLAAAGGLPDGRVLLVLAVATAVVATPLAHRRLRAVTLLPVTGVWQWLLHQGLAVPTSPGRVRDGAAVHPAQVGVVDHGLHAGHGVGALDVGPLDVGPLDVGPLDVGPLAVGPLAAAPAGAVAPVLMTAAHVLATVLTVALLVTTERATDRALRRLAWALPVLAGPLALAAPVAGRVPVATHVVAALLPLRILGAHGCRAPPRAVLAA